MATEIKLPKLGATTVEAKILKWFKKVGDKVEIEEPILEVSTEKINAEIPSPASGILMEILAKEGAIVPINSVIAILDVRS